MSNSYPWFKFTPQEWRDGAISECSYEAQGIFINIAIMYWNAECDLQLPKVQRKFKRNIDALNELIEFEVFVVNNGKIVIGFLDEQFANYLKYTEQQRIKGQKSAAARKAKKQSNHGSTAVKQRLSSGSTKSNKNIDKEYRVYKESNDDGDTRAHAREGTRPTTTSVFKIDDLVAELQNAHNWQTDVARRLKEPNLLKNGTFGKMLDLFCDELKAQGTDYKHIGDAKKHFLSWLRLQKKRLKN